MMSALYKLYQFLMERKKYIFFFALVYLFIMLYWNTRHISTPANAGWTLFQLPGDSLINNFNNQSDNLTLSIGEVGFETFDYDVHLEFQGDIDNHEKYPGEDTVKTKHKSDSSAESLLVMSTPSQLVLLEGPSSDGLLLTESNNYATPGRLNVAIGSGLTSAKLLNLNEATMLQKMVLFQSFIPSFCETVGAAKNYSYHFYFAYDYTDSALDGLVRKGVFHRKFSESVEKKCPKGLHVHLHFVQCDHTRRPAWAQNDAMIEAYLDNVDYFYRINDDTLMKTPGWTEKFVEVLKKYDPANVGVVGPSHAGGNTAILTYDFVHKTHVEVFGFYYPRLFTDWWGDDWITRVYRPDRSTKLQSVFLQHTLALGQRYEVKDWGVAKKLEDQLNRDKKTLERYLRLVEKNSQKNLKPDGTRVISMSLFGSNPRHTWGAIRNAQLVRILFPTWKLRFYVSSSSIEPDTLRTPTTDDIDLHDHRPANVTSLKVSRRLLKRLKLLGAEIKLVKHELVRDIKPQKWRNLAIMDEKVEWLLVRNVDSRLTEIESVVVENWIENFNRRFKPSDSLLSLSGLAEFIGSFIGLDASSQQNSNSKMPAFLHVIRDHPDFLQQSFPGGMWGGNAKMLKVLMDRTIQSVLNKNISEGNSNVSLDVVKFKIEKLGMKNPYLNPGLEQLVRKWFLPGSPNLKKDQFVVDYLNELSKRLEVDRLDLISCNGELLDSVGHFFAGQRFDEHELPFLNNKDFNSENSYDNIEKVNPEKLCQNKQKYLKNASTTILPAMVSPSKTTTDSVRRSLSQFLTAQSVTTVRTSNTLSEKN